MRVYIAGPIAGFSNGNREAFIARAEQLRAAGHDPLNPWDIPVDEHDSNQCIGHQVEREYPTDHRYGCFLRKGLIGMMFCEGISLLDGWESSVGARTEEHVARSIGMTFIDIPQ